MVFAHRLDNFRLTAVLLGVLDRIFEPGMTTLRQELEKFGFINSC